MMAQSETNYVNNLNAKEALIIIWEKKYFVLLGATLMLILGILYCFLTKPVYSSYAILAPKKSEGQSSGGLFSQLGGLTASLGLANNSLNRLDILLRSRDLAKSVVSNYPVYPQLFPQMWDHKKNVWNEKYLNSHPEIEDVAEMLTELLVETELNIKKEMLTLSIKAPSSKGAVKMIEFYIQELNNRVRTDVIREAESNKAFLENQLSLARDPLMREKIHTLIGSQIEKAMLVSSNSFDVLQTPYESRFRISPKRKQIIVLSFLFGGIFSAVVIVVLHFIKKSEFYRNQVGDH